MSDLLICASFSVVIIIHCYQYFQLVSFPPCPSMSYLLYQQIIVLAFTFPGHNDWLYLVKSTRYLIILGKARDGMGSRNVRSPWLLPRRPWSSYYQSFGKICSLLSDKYIQKQTLRSVSKNAFISKVDQLICNFLLCLNSSWLC